ncbi:hypothetical protein SLGD_00415 [Staphylococcus lugdunensis HKU09-01]|nr:hypothetical protein SLGD_00415 [Staphylococcus lugdunensis HKU09-01]BBN84439.1 hypothetical protein MRSL_04790 [Staphylococcus lugdunensis]
MRHEHKSYFLRFTNNEQDLINLIEEISILIVPHFTTHTN